MTAEELTMPVRTSTAGRVRWAAARISRPGSADALFAAAVVLARTGLVLAWALMVVALANAWSLWPAVAFPMVGAFAAAGTLALIGRRRVTNEVPVAAGGETSWAELLIGAGS